MKENKKYINIDLKYYSNANNENNIEIIVNDKKEMTKTIKENEKIEIQFFKLNEKTKISPFLIISTEDDFSESLILDEIYKAIINKSQIELLDISEENEYNNNKFIFHISPEKFLFKKAQVKYFEIGGAKSFIPILEIVSNDQDLFQEISKLIFNIISSNYINFIDAIYSNVFHSYYFLCKNNKKEIYEVKIIFSIYEILIMDETINELIQTEKCISKLSFFNSVNDKFVSYIYRLLFELMTETNESGDNPKDKNIVVFLFEYLKQKKTFSIGDKKKSLIESSIDKINQVLNEFLPKKKLSMKNSPNSSDSNYKILIDLLKDKNIGLIKWIISNSNKKLNFFTEDFHRYDLIYISFELCLKYLKLLEKEKNLDEIEFLIIVYIIISLKFGINCPINERMKSIFYDNANFLILLLNLNDEKRSLNSFLNFIVGIIEYKTTPGIFDKMIGKSNYLNHQDLPYYNFLERFSNILNLNEKLDTNLLKKMKSSQNIQEQIKNFKYSINSPLRETYQDYLNLKLFRDLKKELFSWNSTYSDENDFYIEKNIKFKRCFHLTKDMAVPLIEPILDYNYYKSNFAQNFEPMEIKYNYNLFKYEYNIEKKIEKSFNCKMNKINYHIFGYFKCGGCYYEFIGNGESTNDLYLQLGSLGKYNETTKDNNYYVRLYFHKINIILKRKYYFKDVALEIYYENNKSYFFIFNEEKERDSMFEKVNNYNIFNDIKLSEINGKFNIHYYMDLSDISKIIEKWENNSISTFQYLMWINILGSRSYRDLSQYPVFPWILNNYLQNQHFLKTKMFVRENEDLILECLFNNFQRDLDSPMGALLIDKKSEKRNQYYIDTYTEIIDEHYKNNYTEKKSIENKKNIKKINNIENKTYETKDLIELMINPELEEYKEKRPNYTKDKLNIQKLYSDPSIQIENIPYYFGSHYSNPAYTCYYLSRIFPFSFAACEIQGLNFGAADRLFMNMERSFTSAASERSDLRELIPEIYFLPDLFENNNKLNFGYLQDKSNNENATSKILRSIRNLKEGDKIDVQEVLTGFWNENKPEFFVFLYRKLLENKKLEINKWINLIFGKYSYGDEARKKGNLFMPYCYDNVINCRLNKIEEDMKYSYFKLYELGVNPKSVVMNVNKFDDKKKVINGQNFESIIIARIKKGVNCKEVMKNFFPPEFTIDVKKKSNNIDEFKLLKFTKLFLKQLDKGGLLNDNDDFAKNNSLIFSSLSIYKYNDFNFHIYGCEDGSTVVFKTKPNYKSSLYKFFHNHSKKINYLNTNNNLNMLIDCSDDGYINLYTLPNFKLIRSMRKIGIKYVFLTSSPLIGFVAISDDKYSMYSINGKKIISINERLIIYKPIIIHDDEFNDYLFYNNKELLKLPLLQKYINLKINTDK